ncbi:hypothetical protein SDC9_57469 [bioreactor metagenome]|uniref:Uncharacterized protein n=1 Tax=bioreactor metagenome TaxID=1076179 RepID=A0A644X4N3_9ZZZZ
MMITSDHRGFAEVQPTATHPPPVSIRSPELKFLAHGCLPMRARSVGAGWLAPGHRILRSKKKKTDRHRQAITLLFYINHFFQNNAASSKIRLDLITSPRLLGRCDETVAVISLFFGRPSGAACGPAESVPKNRMRSSFG